jgi:hypothetical protein
VIAVIDGGTLNAQTSSILVDNYSTNGWLFRLAQYGATDYMGVTKTGFTGGDGNLTSTLTNPLDGERHVVGMTIGPDQDWEPHVWKDGIKAVCGSGTSTAAPSGGQAGGPMLCGENGYLYADLYVLYIWTRVLSDDEIREVMRDPFGLIRPVTPYWSRMLYETPSGATLEQEGYRWRLDDGSESGATWLDTQDTNITRQKNLNTRIRIIVNATGDPDSEQYQLEWREKGSGDPWRKVTE